MRRQCGADADADVADDADFDGDGDDDDITTRERQVIGGAARRAKGGGALRRLDVPDSRALFCRFFVVQKPPCGAGTAPGGWPGDVTKSQMLSLFSGLILFLAFAVRLAALAGPEADLSVWVFLRAVKTRR